MSSDAVIVPQRHIGGVAVGAIGLGAMPLSIAGRPDRLAAIETVRAALNAGATLIDTADAYYRDAGEIGHNEILIADALASYGDVSRVLVATKGGRLRSDDGSLTLNGRPEYLKSAARASARRLRVEVIDLYQFHRPDPFVPYADSIGALSELLDEGIIRMAGISNVSTDQVLEARNILGGSLVSVQNQFSPQARLNLPVLELCSRLGLAFLPWSPLGGIGRTGQLAGSGTALDHIASQHGVSAQRVALAWELALSPTVIPIPGASRSASIEDSVHAAVLALSPTEIAEISA